MVCAAAGAWLVALMRECGVRPVRGFVGFLKGQPKAGRVIIGVFLAALSPSFGLPMPVCTNAECAAALTLATDVLLGGMNIHVGFEGADASFALWVRRRGGWRRIASSGGGSLDVMLPAWRSLVGARPRRRGRLGDAARP